MVKSYKKLSYDKLSQEVFKRKDYLRDLSLEDGRMMFKLNCEMCPGIKINFQNDKKFTDDLWSCITCNAIQSQNHLEYCIIYSDLRDNKDLTKDTDLVQYFREVITRQLASECIP